MGWGEEDIKRDGQRGGREEKRENFGTERRRSGVHAKRVSNCTKENSNTDH